jgi:hypothetical protein
MSKDFFQYKKQMYNRVIWSNFVLLCVLKRQGSSSRKDDFSASTRCLRIRAQEDIYFIFIVYTTKQGPPLIRARHQRLLSCTLKVMACNMIKTLLRMAGDVYDS